MDLKQRMDAALEAHIAAKMRHRFSRERPGRWATTLTADSVTLTAVANAGRFESVVSAGYSQVVRVY